MIEEARHHIAEAILTGNMGDCAVRVLKANGIEVVGGTSGAARAGAENWPAAALKDSGEGCLEHGTHEHEAHDCGH
jgi:predicted Fe-Mo cluster-binding NifX family protein